MSGHEQEYNKTKLEKEQEERTLRQPEPFYRCTDCHQGYDTHPKNGKCKSFIEGHDGNAMNCTGVVIPCPRTGKWYYDKGADDEEPFGYYVTDGSGNINNAVAVIVAGAGDIYVAYDKQGEKITKRAYERLDTVEKIVEEWELNLCTECGRKPMLDMDEELCEDCLNDHVASAADAAYEAYKEDQYMREKEQRHGQDIQRATNKAEGW